MSEGGCRLGRVICLHTYQAMLDVGVRLLPQGEVDMEKRSHAVASILQQVRHAKPSPKGQSERDFLAQVRARQVR